MLKKGTYIHATKHAIKRYKERIKKVRRNKAIKKIVKGIQCSRLIAFAQGNEREIREHRGTIYVCSFEKNKDRLNVITILNSKADLRFDNVDVL